MQNYLSSVWRPSCTTYVQLNRAATESHKNKWCRTDGRETWHHTDGRNGQSSMLDREGRLQCGRHWVADSRIHDSRTLIRTNCPTFMAYLFQNTDAKRTRWWREEDQMSQFVKAYDSSDAKSNTQLDPRALRRKIYVRRGPLHAWHWSRGPLKSMGTVARGYGFSSIVLQAKSSHVDREGCDVLCKRLVPDCVIEVSSTNAKLRTTEEDKFLHSIRDWKLSERADVEIVSDLGGVLPYYRSWPRQRTQVHPSSFWRSASEENLCSSEYYSLWRCCFATRVDCNRLVPSVIWWSQGNSLTIACSRANTLRHRNRLCLMDTWIWTVLSVSADSHSTILHPTMTLTEQIQQFEDIVHTSLLCTTDPADSKRFAYLLDKVHDLRISYARRRPFFRPIPWNLDVFFAFSIRRTVCWTCVPVVAFSVFSMRFTIGDLVRRSSSCACHPVESWRLLHLLDSVDGVVISYLRRLSELPIVDQKRVYTSVDDSHVPNVISTQEVLGILTSDILWIKLCVDSGLRRT